MKKLSLFVLLGLWMSVVGHAQLGDILTDVVKAKTNKKLRKVSNIDDILPDKIKLFHCKLLIASSPREGLAEGASLFRTLEEKGDKKEDVIKHLKEQSKSERDRADLSNFSEKIYCLEQTFLPEN